MQPLNLQRRIQPLTDFETSVYLPWIDMFPATRSAAYKTVAPLTYHFLYVLGMIVDALKKAVLPLMGEAKPKLSDTIPLLQLLVLCCCTDNGPLHFVVMQGVAVWWMIFTSQTTTHRHPAIFHWGDKRHRSRV